MCCLKQEVYRLCKLLVGSLALIHKALSLESLEFRWKRTNMLAKLEQTHEIMARKGEPGPFGYEYSNIQTIQ